MSAIEGRDGPSVMGGLAGLGLGVLALLGGGVLVVLVFSVFVLHGDNYRLLLPARTPPPADWMAYRGDISFDDEGAVIHGLSPRGMAIVAIPLYRPVNPRYLERVELTYQTPQAAHRVQLGLVPSGEAQGNPPIVPFSISGNGRARVPAATLRQVQGEVSTVFIIYQARFVDALRINTLRFVPSKPGLTELYKRIWADWAELAPWRQSSINFIRVGGERPLVSPVVAAAAWGATALVLLGLLGLIAGRLGVGLRGSSAALAIVAVCWFALDARWQADLFYKSAQTYQRFAGKTTAEKHRADVDGELYTFVTRAKQRMTGDTSRVFIRGGTEFRSLRARYHVLPHPAEASDRSLIEWAGPQLRPSDYVMLLDDNALQVGQFASADERGDSPSGVRFTGDQIAHEKRDERDAWSVRARSWPAGYYRVQWTFKAPDKGFPVRARALGKFAVGDWQTLASREITTARAGKLTLMLPVFVPETMRLRLRLRSEARVSAISIQPLAANAQRRYLSSGSGPPYIVVNKLLAEGERRLFSIL